MIAPESICDGCRYLVYEDAINRYDYYLAMCSDPERAMWGKRRTVAASRAGRPFQIRRPTTCRGKEIKHGN